MQRFYNNHIVGDADVIDNPQHDYDEWIIFNDLESGHFRVNYDAAQWDNLTKQLISDHTVCYRTRSL